MESRSIVCAVLVFGLSGLSAFAQEACSPQATLEEIGNVVSLANGLQRERKDDEAIGLLANAQTQFLKCSALPVAMIISHAYYSQALASAEIDGEPERVKKWLDAFFALAESNENAVDGVELFRAYMIKSHFEFLELQYEKALTTRRDAIRKFVNDRRPEVEAVAVGAAHMIVATMTGSGRCRDAQVIFDELRASNQQWVKSTIVALERVISNCKPL